MRTKTTSYTLSHTVRLLSIILFLICISACGGGTAFDSLQKKGTSLFGKKQYQEALVYYEQALLLKPKSASIHINIGLCYRKFNLYKKAGKYFATAIEYETRLDKLDKYDKLLEEAYKVHFTDDVEPVDNISVYEEFLEDFPIDLEKYPERGRLEEMKFFKKAAVARLEELIFIEVRQTNVPRAYQLYMEDYPNSKYIKEALLLLDTLLFEITLEMNAIEAFQDFIDKYPESNFADRAQVKVDGLVYEDYKFKASKEGYEEFATKYPENIHREDALNRLYKLIKPKKDIKLLEEFLRNFPDSTAAKDVKKEIEKLR
ncbi:tetratricopeptide repeat protein [Thermodesulfobacteriota bacterium]